MANPLSNPAGNVAQRWVYQAIFVEMAGKTVYGLRATQRHKEIRGIFIGGIWPIAKWTWDSLIVYTHFAVAMFMRREAE